MAGYLDPIPRAEIGKDLAFRLFDLLFDESNFLFEADFQRMSFGMFLQLLELMLQFNNRLFEVELMFHPLNFSDFPTSVQSGI